MARTVELIAANWHWIAPVLFYVLLSTYQLLTAHHTQWSNTLARGIHLLIEVLSMTTSRGVVTGTGPFKRLKLPGQDIPPQDDEAWSEDPVIEFLDEGGTTPAERRKK